MQIHKPLWHEGVILAPQHFQQQESWLLHMQQLIATMAVAEPWGVLAVSFDDSAIETGHLSTTSMRLRFPDGTVLDTRTTDTLPPARRIDTDFPPGVDEIIVYAGLPLWRADGANCRLDDEPSTRPRRYFREFVQVDDAHGSASEEMAVERKAVRLLFDFETLDDDVVCAVARLVPDGRGRYALDRDYVPPCAALSAHTRHTRRMRRVIDILQAKAAALGERRSERRQQVTEFGIGDVSLFWMLHCIHTAWPRLTFLASHPQQPPERLYQVLAELASALMTFSSAHSLTSLPLYDHRRQDDIFDNLEATIRTLLDAVIASRVVPVGLSHTSPVMWSGTFQDERMLTGADYYLSVSADMPAATLIEQVPLLCKIGSPDDVAHIVNSALAGVPLKLATRVPAAIPVRLENHYFALDASDPAHARMIAARACQVYLPASIPDVSLELFAVLPA